MPGVRRRIVSLDVSTMASVQCLCRGQVRQRDRELILQELPIVLVFQQRQRASKQLYVQQRIYRG